MPATRELSDSSAGTARIGDDIEVRRLAYGAMRITGKGVWGPPADPEEARAVLRRAAELGICFFPWFPLAAGDLAKPDGIAAEIAGAHSASTGQVALAWLLHRSPAIVPIPGTSSVRHLEENVAATEIELSGEEVQRLTSAA